jgi:DNA adenine methylase
MTPTRPVLRYHPLDTRSIGNPYCKKGYRHEMTDAQHRELATTLHSLTGMVVLSGYPCEMYDRELYPDWQRVTRKALADGARTRTEVLWLNPAAADRPQGSIFDAESAA